MQTKQQTSYSCPSHTWSFFFFLTKNQTKSNKSTEPPLSPGAAHPRGLAENAQGAQRRPRVIGAGAAPSCGWGGRERFFVWRKKLLYYIWGFGFGFGVFGFWFSVEMVILMCFWMFLWLLLILLRCLLFSFFDLRRTVLCFRLRSFSFWGCYNIFLKMEDVVGEISSIILIKTELSKHKKNKDKDEQISTLKIVHCSFWVNPALLVTNLAFSIVGQNGGPGEMADSRSFACSHMRCYRHCAKAFGSRPIAKTSRMFQAWSSPFRYCLKAPKSSAYAKGLRFLFRWNGLELPTFLS